MVILHLADLHIKLKHDKRYRKDLISFIRFFLEVLDKTKPDFVFLAGDVFDTKLPTPAELSLATAFIKRILDKNIRLVIIPGNHDIPAHEGSHHTMQPLENLKLKNLHILSEASIYSIGGIDILAVPYKYLNKQECMATVKSLHDSYTGSNLFMIGHLWVKDYLPVDPPAGEFVVDRQFLMGLTKVKYGALGHIHNGGQACGSFFYSGSPFRVTTAEEEPAKYMYAWQDGKVGMIQTPACPIVRLDVSNLQDISGIKNSICVIKAKDITVDYLPTVSKLKAALEEQGNFVSINLELKKIAFGSVASVQDTSMESFIDDYVKKNNIPGSLQPILSICQKIVTGSISKETSVFSVDELGIRDEQ